MNLQKARELPGGLLDSSVVITMPLKLASWLLFKPPGLLLLVPMPPSMGLSENSSWGISVQLRSRDLILESFPCSGSDPSLNGAVPLPTAGYGTTTCRQPVQTLVSIMLFLNLAWAFSSACKKTSPYLLRNFYLCHMHQESSFRHSSDDHKSLFSMSVWNYILEIREKVV